MILNNKENTRMSQLKVQQSNKGTHSRAPFCPSLGRKAVWFILMIANFSRRSMPSMQERYKVMATWGEHSSFDLTSPNLSHCFWMRSFSHCKRRSFFCDLLIAFIHCQGSGWVLSQHVSCDRLTKTLRTADQQWSLPLGLRIGRRDTRPTTYARHDRKSVWWNRSCHR